jgi:hypothetical protein
MGINAVLPSQVLADGASDGDLLTVQADGSVAFETPAGGGGIGGSTGATDNAVLRADGTGGSTLQDSGWVVPDIYTASPNATVNHLSMQATGATTNVSVSIVPKGTGSFSLAVPDGTTTGGNVRGTNAIDLQTTRTAATQVASGTRSVVIGARNTASGTDAVAVGYLSVASGVYSVAIGRSQALGSGSICVSNETGVAAGNGSIVFGPASARSDGDCSMAFGGTARTNRANEIAYGFRHSAFDVRPGSFLLSCKTTDATPTALVLQNIFGSANFTTRSGVVLHGTLHVTGVKSDGSAVAIYTRRIVLKNVGGTITLVESQTIGTDYEDNASTDLTISGTSPFFQVTGIASETWRWVGWFCPTVELAYGT